MTLHQNSFHAKKKQNRLPLHGGVIQNVVFWVLTPYADTVVSEEHAVSSFTAKIARSKPTLRCVMRECDWSMPKGELQRLWTSRITERVFWISHAPPPPLHSFCWHGTGFIHSPFTIAVHCSLSFYDLESPAWWRPAYAAETCCRGNKLCMWEVSCLLWQKLK